MAVTNLNNKKEVFDTGMDNIVIVDNFQSIRGGRSLNVTGYPKDVIRAGHVIIKEASTGDYKPMPLNSGGTEYGELPSGHDYVGILIATVAKDKPFAGIMVRGTVNPNATPFKMTAIMDAVKKALPLIDFRAD